MRRVTAEVRALLQEQQGRRQAELDVIRELDVQPSPPGRRSESSLSCAVSTPA